MHDIHENGVKDLVVLALAREWPLTAQQLYERILKERSDIGYHAVHKCCQQLLKSGVTKREEKGYLISSAWLEKVSAIVDTLKRSYVYNKPLFLPSMKDLSQEGDTRTFTFDNLAEADNYRKRLQWEYLVLDGAKHPYCAMSRHLRSPLFASERSLNIMSMATKAKSNAFIMCAGSTVIDEWCADYYRNAFVRVQTGINCAQACDTSVLGDVVVQTYVPEHLQTYINQTYKNANLVDSINIPEFYKNVYQKKAEIKMTLFRNAEIAAQLRQQVMGSFNATRLAIFDINGTLVDGFLVTDFAEYFAMRGHFSEGRLDSIRVLDRAYKKGEVSFDKASREIIEEYAAGLSGQSVEDISKLAQDFVEEGRVPFFKFSKRLVNLVNSYCITLAITKGTSEIVDALKYVFPFDAALTSKLEIKDGLYTGRTSCNLAGRGVKEAALREWLARRKYSLSKSLGFGDSHHDLSFLSKVEIPVAVNPTKKLAEHAKKHGWVIFSNNENFDNAVLKISQILHK